MKLLILFLSLSMVACTSTAATTNETTSVSIPFSATYLFAASSCPLSSSATEQINWSGMTPINAMSACQHVYHNTLSGVTIDWYASVQCNADGTWAVKWSVDAQCFANPVTSQQTCSSFSSGGTTYSTQFDVVCQVPVAPTPAASAAVTSYSGTMYNGATSCSTQASQCTCKCRPTYFINGALTCELVPPTVYGPASSVWDCNTRYGCYSGCSECDYPVITSSAIGTALANVPVVECPQASVTQYSCYAPDSYTGTCSATSSFSFGTDNATKQSWAASCQANWTNICNGALCPCPNGWAGPAATACSVPVSGCNAFGNGMYGTVQSSSTGYTATLFNNAVCYGPPAYILTGSSGSCSAFGSNSLQLTYTTVTPAPTLPTPTGSGPAPTHDGQPSRAFATYAWAWPNQFAAVIMLFICAIITMAA